MPATLPSTDALQVKAGSENFPVALRLLPRRTRTELLAVYGFARLVDDVGDEGTSGESAGGPRRLDADLSPAFVGPATHPVVARLTPDPAGPRQSFALFRDLIEANRRDQAAHRYATFDELLDYCRLSANPVGRWSSGSSASATPDAAAVVRRRVHAACRWSSTARTSARTPAAGGSTCRRRPARRSACADDDLLPRRVARAGVRAARRCPRSSGPAPCSARARPGRRACPAATACSPSPASSAGGLAPRSTPSTRPATTCSAIAAGRPAGARSSPPDACCGRARPRTTAA